MRAVSYLAPGLPAALFETLADVIGADLWFETRTSGPVPGDDPFADGRADLGWICSTSYADRSWVAGAGVASVGVGWIPDDPDSDGRAVYFGDLVTRPGSDVAGLHHLAGRRVGCNDPVSLSGHHALRIAAADAGIDLEDVEIVFTGGHQASMDAVAAGTLDAAVVDSVARTIRARRDPAVASLRVATRFGPWPVQPLVARADVDPHVIATIRRRLFDAADDLRVLAALRDASLLGLAPTSEADYTTVADALMRTAVALSGR